MKMKNFKVTTKCGHVGKNNYILIDFAIKAKSKKEAAAIAKRIPRVKHHKKDAIVDCVEITEEEFNEILMKNNEDLYLQCKNIQDQRKIEGFESRILTNEIEVDVKALKEARLARVAHKRNKYKELVEDSVQYMNEIWAYGY